MERNFLGSFLAIDSIIIIFQETALSFLLMRGRKKIAAAAVVVDLLLANHRKTEMALGYWTEQIPKNTIVRRFC